MMARRRKTATPGLVIGQLHLWKRVGLTIGGGYQIATTHFHTTNHNAILSIRFPILILNRGEPYLGCRHPQCICVLAIRPESLTRCEW